ncbi:MAG: hypothetical protein GXP22_08530 [Gammaproteobacteria bacterium]|nr:hypothetical protein [Gammaproteobacteria bacterium]
MRVLKRFIENLRGEWFIRHRREEIRRELIAFFSSEIKLIQAGQRGHDSIYYVNEDNGNTIAMLRLSNPYKKRSPPANDMPFIALDTDGRISREWDCYRQGGELTPEPLWQSIDALVCGYLPMQSLQDIMMSDRDYVWAILCKATMALHQLHQQGVTHMDASLANILSDADMEQMVFIDFEYGPSLNVTEKQQRAYDFLRLVESVWKFIPEEQRSELALWEDCLASCLEDDMQGLDLEPLWPALTRLKNDEAMFSCINRIFNV